jgi:uncharacterized protein YdgA (DUF945 family)
MNKTGRVAGITVAAIGAGWVGSTWYSSQHTEIYYQQNIQQFNATTLSPVSIKLTSFKQGFLQSRANWEISLTLDPCQPDNSMVLTGYDEIQHGFIPSLGWASIKSHIIWPDSVEARMRQIFKGQEPLTIYTRVNLLGSTSTRLQSPTAQWQGDNFQINWQGLQGSLKLSNSNKIRFDLKAPKLLLKNLASTTESIAFDEIRYRGEKKTGNSMLPLGDTTLSLHSVQAQLGQQQWGLRDLTFISKNQINKDMLSASASYKIDQFLLNQKNVGNFKANLMLGHIPVQAAQQSYVAFNRLQRQCNPSAQDLLKALEPVLKKGFQVNLSQADLTLFNGEAQANALIVMQPLSVVRQQSIEQILEKLMVNGKLQVSDQLLGGVFEQLNRLKGQQISPAEAEQTVHMLMQGILEQGYLTKTATGYQTTFAVTEGRTTINGKALIPQPSSSLPSP